MRVAFIHDWLFGMRGGEKCLEEMVRMYPDCEVFSAFGRVSNLSSVLQEKKIHFSLFNKLPGIENYYRFLLPAYPLVCASIGRELRKRHSEEPFELVVSISHCLAKNVNLPESVPSICYCLTPMRYIYDQFDAYFGRSKLKPLLSVAAGCLRSWDKKRSAKTKSYLAISQFIQERIERTYGVKSAVVYPPVTVNNDEPPSKADKGYYLVANALVPYKNTELIVRAFNELGSKLKIVGTGPELENLQRLANENIEFCGWVKDAELPGLYKGAKAMVFAACEDFGITPVEAQFHGTPVIAYAKGGALETVTSETGEFFNKLTVESLIRAIERFETRSFEPTRCVANADRFSSARFKKDFSCHVEKALPVL